MALGLRYAGTANKNAFKTLYNYAQMFTALSYKTVAELAGKSTVETCLNVVLLSTAVVMAGTGDLDVSLDIHKAYDSYNGKFIDYLIYIMSNIYTDYENMQTYTHSHRTRQRRCYVWFSFGNTYGSRSSFLGRWEIYSF